MKNSSFPLLWILVKLLMTVCATRARLSQNLYRPLRSGVQIEGTILFKFTVRSRLKCPVRYVLFKTINPLQVKKHKLWMHQMNFLSNHVILPTSFRSKVVQNKVFDHHWICNLVSKLDKVTYLHIVYFERYVVATTVM